MVMAHVFNQQIDVSDWLEKLNIFSISRHRRLNEQLITARQAEDGEPDPPRTIPPEPPPNALTHRIALAATDLVVASNLITK
jgi:hypothetical protein